MKKCKVYLTIQYHQDFDYDKSCVLTFRDDMYMKYGLDKMLFDYTTIPNQPYINCNITDPNKFLQFQLTYPQYIHSIE